MSYDLNDFQNEVIEQSQRVPVLVDFWAPWCGPCKMLGPILERLAGEPGSSWVLVKINTESERDLAASFGIRGIPNLKLFHKGQVIAELAGALPEAAMRSWLREHLPSTKREKMALARQALHAGRPAEATHLLKPLFGEDGACRDAELETLFARGLVFSDQAGALAIADRQAPGSAWEDSVMIVRTFASLLQGHSVANPSPTFAEAVRRLHSGQFEAALERFLLVLEEGRGPEWQPAKEACQAIFRHLGMRHPSVEKLTRRFGSAVNI